MPKFIRRSWYKHSRIGKGRKKLQKWRRAKGRHNKTREKRKGYPIKVMVGFRTPKVGRDKILEKKMITVYNIQQLGNVKKGEIALIGKVGNKKKMEMIKMAKEKEIHVYNVNVKKAIKKMELKK